MNETINTIMTRTSCRSYQDTLITDEELQTILLAGIQAPSAMNRQPCECFALVGREHINQLAEAINKVLDKPIDIHQFAYQAPVLVIVAGPSNSPRLQEDGSCLLENMFLAASSLNIGSCWIDQLSDIQDHQIIKDALSSFDIPHDYHVVGCCALGYVKKETPAHSKNESRIHIIK